MSPGGPYQQHPTSSWTNAPPAVFIIRMPNHVPDDPRNHRERVFAGDLYIGGTDPESTRIARRAVQFADAYQDAVADETAARPLLAGVLGALGDGCPGREGHPLKRRVAIVLRRAA